MADPLTPQYTPQYLDPSSIQRYGQARSSARERFGRAAARSTYNIGNLDLQKDRSVRDIQRAYKQSVQGSYEPAGQRGLLRSGIYNRALQQMAEGRDLGLGNLYFQHSSAVGQERLNMSDQEAQLAAALGQINADEWAADVAAGSQLQNQPGLGAGNQALPEDDPYRTGSYLDAFGGNWLAWLASQPSDVQAYFRRLAGN